MSSLNGSHVVHWTVESVGPSRSGGSLCVRYDVPQDFVFYLTPPLEESQRSALCALLKHSWTRRSVIMSDVMRADQGPVLWWGHMGLRVGGQRSEPVLWSGHMGLQGGGQRSEPVLWPGHMGLRVGGQRSEPVLWSGHMGLQVGGQRSEPVLWSGHMGL
ncbi:unnamed protein product [Boreogadus saida]